VATEVATRVDEAEQELLSGLDPDEQDTLITLLDQIG